MDFDHEEDASPEWKSQIKMYGISAHRILLNR